MLANTPTVSRGLFSVVRYFSVAVESQYVAACARTNNLKEALRAYEDMKIRGKELDDEGYSGLLEGMIDAKHHEELANILLEMEQKQRFASQGTYVQLLGYFANYRMLDEAFFTMRRLANNGHTFNRHLRQAIRSYPQLHTKLICHNIMTKE